MIIRDYPPLEIATLQIDTACRIFITGEDFVSALTLAGAGEEILGKILADRGTPNAVEGVAEAFAQIREIHGGKKPGMKESVNALNKARNGAKHLLSGEAEPVQMDPEFEADSMIYRAISNYFSITNTYTEQMIVFLNAQLHRRRH